jgi:hypothetical protein
MEPWRQMLVDIINLTHFINLRFFNEQIRASLLRVGNRLGQLDQKSIGRNNF